MGECQRRMGSNECCICGLEKGFVFIGICIYLLWMCSSAYTAMMIRYCGLDFFRSSMQMKKLDRAFLVRFALGKFL